MSNRVRIAVLVGLAGVVAAGVVAADKPAAAKDPAAHDFGTKVLLVTVRAVGKDAEVSSRVLEAAKTRRLGDAWFVVGVTPDFGAGFENDKGTTVWVPVGEVLQITEYDTLDAVKKMYDKQPPRQRGE